MSKKMPFQPEPKHTPVIDNPWRDLRRFTDARIGLGRSGISQPTKAQLEFQMDHANARDAIHIPFDMALIADNLKTVGIPSLCLSSQAQNRTVYLQRPDLGRRLDLPSVQKLRKVKATMGDKVDVSVVIADGLSSTAVHQHSVQMAEMIINALTEQGFSTAPVMIVTQGRVAIGDEIGELLSAKMLILLVGERPGLSSPDSMGIYYTYQPKLGLTDAYRNCLSNIRPAGMQLKEALAKLLWLMNESLQRHYSGVDLKDESDSHLESLHSEQQIFLLKR